jgi:hypothetical protein
MALNQRKGAFKGRAKYRHLQRKRTHPTSKYRSKFEAGVAASLEQRNLPFSYEPIVLDYVIQAKYTPDLVLSNGIVVELKGFFSAQDRRKMLCVKEQHPELDIRMCFQNAKDKISRAKKSITYGAWATRHGFKWASGTIPSSWYD